MTRSLSVIALVVALVAGACSLPPLPSDAADALCRAVPTLETLHAELSALAESDAEAIATPGSPESDAALAALDGLDTLVEQARQAIADLPEIPDVPGLGDQLNEALDAVAAASADLRTAIGTGDAETVQAALDAVDRGATLLAAVLLVISRIEDLPCEVEVPGLRPSREPSPSPEASPSPSPSPEPSPSPSPEPSPSPSPS
ncbi:MAG TPA: hypothetical protein VLA23_07375, partial [Candidatus Limnocylindrales bacterium]|nr:hypothetical protein [Candidatus Limnocylindrales bacterium]